MGNVIALKGPEAPLTLAVRLAVRRAYRMRCKAVAELYVAQAFSESYRGVEGLGSDYTMAIFVAAMRRELRRTGLF
jgi:hypothetical protein